MNLLELDALSVAKEHKKLDRETLFHALFALKRDISTENKEVGTIATMMMLLAEGLYSRTPIEDIVKSSVDTFADSVFYLKRHVEKHMKITPNEDKDSLKY